MFHVVNAQKGIQYSRCGLAVQNTPNRLPPLFCTQVFVNATSVCSVCVCVCVWQHNGLIEYTHTHIHAHMYSLNAVSPPVQLKPPLT